MELLTPDSEDDDWEMRNSLNKLGAGPDTLHVGATSISGDYRWYSVESGKVFSYDFEWKKANDLSYSDKRQFRNNIGTKNPCLLLMQLKKDFTYGTTGCFNKTSRFACQKIEPHIAGDCKT